MPTIEVDFEVWKELVARRESEKVSENDVLRALFKLPTPKATAPPKAQKTKGLATRYVVLPAGMQLRAIHKGEELNAVIEDGAVRFNGKQYKSVSDAASAATGYPTNGWLFWDAWTPTSDKYVSLNKLRQGVQG